MNRANTLRAIYDSTRQACWFLLFMSIGMVGCLVAFIADAAAWCEDKLRDALSVVEDHLEL